MTTTFPQQTSDITDDVNVERPKPKVTIVILTYNEEIHIERAISSARQISDDILVVDSFSKDFTVELAKNAGARVIQNVWTNHSRQFQWGLENGGIAGEWILRLDADEIIGRDLAERINSALVEMPDDVAGVIFNRRHIFMNRWVKHGGRYPLPLLRLWRVNRGRVEDRWMDEHVVVWNGRTVCIDGEFSDASKHDLSFFVAKHNDYASREAVEILNDRYDLFPRTRSIAHNKRMPILKNIYRMLPFGVAPILYFIYRYFLQFGFLDGKTGLIYHFLQGFWYRFLVEAKVLEYDQTLRPLGSREQRVAALCKLTGFAL